MQKTKLFLVLLLIGVIAKGQTKSHKLNESDEKQIEQIIAQMQLSEKITMLGGYKDFNIRALPRLGIPNVRMADGPVGIRNYGESNAYFTSIGMAATWDTALMKQFGETFGSEARSKEVQILLGPGLNIYRAPMCGRNFEYMGEDPYLTGKMASVLIQGIQKQGVMATIKHFVANNQEFDRHNVSSDIDERTLQEIYFPAFKTCIQEGGVGSLMMSYNLLNGEHTSQSKYLMHDILKGEWGFDGFVMSDWWSTYSVNVANNGLDLEMPISKYMNIDSLMPLVNKGILSEQVIDDKIRRMLRMYYYMGFMGKPKSENYVEFSNEEANRLIIESARGGIVLLKNSGLLPVNFKNFKKIAVIGPVSHPANTGGGGAAYVRPISSYSVYDAIKNIAGSTVDVKNAIGTYEVIDDRFYNLTEFDSDSVKVEVFNNKKLEGLPVIEKVYKKLNLVFDVPLGDGIDMNKFSVRATAKYTPKKSGKFKIAVSGDDGYRFWLNNTLIFDEWKDQAETPNNKEFEMVAGKVYDFKMELFQGDGGAAMRMGVLAVPANPFNEAVELAKQTNLAIVCVGFDKTNELEGFDRPFSLPKQQIELIEAVSKVNKNTIVVLNAGGNAGIGEWIDKVPAIIHAWYPGQSGNIALAEIIAGITNPSGKLPISIEKRWEDNPTFNSYFDTDSNKRVTYSEGIFVGYRGYDKNMVEPLFPFGFGLSYTKFNYSNIKLNSNKLKVGNNIEVTVDISNVGNFAGSEIVQLYISDTESSLPRPPKELKDFTKVHLNVGETKTVKFEIKSDALMYYNPLIKQWVAEPGEFKVLVGASSRDIKLSKDFELEK